MTVESLSAVVNHLWQSTLFAGIVALLTLVLRKNAAAVRHRLWMAASIKFLVPFSLLVSAGSHCQWRPISAVAQPAIVEAVGGITRPFAFENSKSVETAVSRIAPRPAPLSRPSNGLAIALIGLWLCGAAAVAFSWLREWRRLRQVLKIASDSPLRLPIRTLSSPVCLEPGIVGIFRPVLLLPEGITERLTKAQLEAILIHELCHVRRRDNLTAAIHLMVETIFWFHPLVWWLERRLVAERERACDEEVLRVVTEPEDYAEGILNVCKFYRESPLVCMSGVTGSNLKNRIEEIMVNRIIQKLGLGKTILLVIVALAAIAAPLAFGVAQASQNPEGGATTNERGIVENSTNSTSESQAAAESGSGSWLDRIEAAGLRNLNVEQIIRLKEHDIDADYIRQVRAMGFDLDADTLIRFQEHDISSEYINELKQVGLRDLTADELIRLQEHDAKPAWIRQIHSMGFENVSADDIIRLLEHDVTPEYVRLAQNRFKGITVDQVVRLKEHDILPVR